VNPGVYLITGYPRSRTAWLSNFMTYGPSFCFHELGASAHPCSFPDILNKMRVPYAGVCDSRALLYQEIFMEDFPEAKVVIIERKREEVVKSMDALGFDFEEASWAYERQIRRMEQYQPLRMPFEELDAGAIWNFCVPGFPVNIQRMKMLEGFKVILRDKELYRHGRL
jgi:hypothetical protein